MSLCAFMPLVRVTVLPLTLALPSFMALRAAAKSIAVVSGYLSRFAALGAVVCAVAQVVRVRERIISMAAVNRFFIGWLL